MFESKTKYKVEKAESGCHKEENGTQSSPALILEVNYYYFSPKPIHLVINVVLRRDIPKCNLA